METSTVERAGAEPGPDDAARRAQKTRRRRRLRAGRGRRSAQAQITEELEVELALLREENARLKVTRQRVRDRPVSERVRELLPSQEAVGDAASDPWEQLIDGLLLRDGLIDACRELELSMREARQRLEAIAPGDARPRSHGDLLGRPTARADLESAA